jgi:FkbM family methyltransferase
MRGREIWIRPDVTIASIGSGDYRYDANQLSERSIVYAFGIGDSISFERDLITACRATVHAFDPTPFTLEWLKTVEVPERFVFHPWAVAGADGALRMFPRRKQDGRRSKVMWTVHAADGEPTEAIDVSAYSIPSVLNVLGHERVDLVKLDVEGAEYEAIEAMLRGACLPTQLLVEFHHRFKGIGPQKTLDCIARLRAAGYSVFWVSQTGREVGFIRGH